MEAERDQELGRRLTEHDSSVLDCILRAYGPRVGGWLRQEYPNLLGREDVHDVLSGALYKLWNERIRFDPSRSSLRNYFFMIARCVAIDMIRREQGRTQNSEVLLGDMADQIIAGDPAPSPDEEPPERPDRAQRSRDLSDCIKKLSPNSRIIVLGDANDKFGVVPSEVWARELNISKGAVRVARKRGLDRLREAMRKLGY